MAKSYWLLKSEPRTYSFDDLLRDGRTHWDGVRNYQARNNLRQIAVGDTCLIYHSGDDKAVMGLAKVIRGAYPDVDPQGGDWVQIDIQPLKPMKKPVTLKEIKANSALKEFQLVRNSRLSVMPVSSEHFQILLKMGATS